MKITIKIPKNIRDRIIRDYPNIPEHIIHHAGIELIEHIMHPIAATKAKRQSKRGKK